MTQRYLVKTGTHLGPIRRNILTGQIIEWNPDTGKMTIDGHEVSQGKGVDTFTGMKTLLTLSERSPEDPFIVALGPAPDEKTLGSSLKTDTLCTMPILGCLQAAEIFTKNAKPEWRANSARQVEFLEKFKRYWANPSNLPELRSKADLNVDVINKWLKDEGFDIQLDPVDVGFYVASILKLLVEWLKVGEKRDIIGKRDRQTYPGVKLEDGVNLYRDLDVHPFPVASIDTKSGDVVKMAIIDKVPEGAFGLHDLTQTLNKVASPCPNKENVIFPMVELDVKPDISWICGMLLDPFYIQQALQQTKFRMNERGAKVESAVAMSMRCMGAASEPEPYVIDRPFLLWIERAGVAIPFFAAVLCEDVWKEPKEL